MDKTYAMNLGRLMQRELDRFDQRHPKSKGFYEKGKRAYLYGAPLHWMQNWPGGCPLYVSRARGAHLTDVDGNDYLDLCLGDSGAMFGHGNPHVARAISEQAGKGLTMMLPTPDSVVVGETLKQRFGLSYWQLATSATDANRFAIRLSRMITGRDKILVFNGNYHGSVDETQVELDDQGRMVPRFGVHPNAVDHSRTTRLVEFNDVAALAGALVHGDVACVLAEPVMTNIGMVPARPGYHEALRRLTRESGTVLIIDETHTISTGPGGYTRAFGLEPDIFVLGKAIGGGMPCAVYGVSDEIADRIWRVRPHIRPGKDRNMHSGFGGTLAGNALTLAAIRAVLEHVMTDEAYSRMIASAHRLEEGVSRVIQAYGLPWHVTRIGARAEYMFSPSTPLNGGQARSGRNGPLEAFMHLFFLNRGILLTPFHNMVLVCPEVSERDIEHHNQVFEACVKRLLAG